MLLARVLGGVGRLLIWTGLIVLLFVGYQLWGTNVAEARAQDDLEEQFTDRLGADGETSTTSTTDPDDDTTTTAAPPPPPDDGAAIARIVIPDIGVDKIVVEGVTRSDLRKGPGHYPGTALPGQPGNAAIAGHRTTYGAPFHRIDELQTGAEILVTTLQGSFTYEVTAQQIVRPTDVSVIEDQGDDRLTLTSCHPKYSARERIVVSAELVDEPATASRPRKDSEGDQLSQPEVEVLDGEERGPLEPAIAWGVITFAVWLLIAVISRRWRRWPSYLLGAPVFALVLFVFFQAVAETLPSNF